MPVDSADTSKDDDNKKKHTPPKKTQNANASSANTKSYIKSLINLHLEDDTELARKVFREATNAGIKGGIGNIEELILRIEKTASESKLRKFHAKLGAALIVGNKPI